MKQTLEQLFNQALSWGMTYGNTIPASQWDSMRNAQSKALCEQAALIDKDTVSLYGVKDGKETYLCEVAIPPSSKAVDIVESYFGHISAEDEENFTPGAMALQCCKDLIAYIKTIKTIKV